MLHMLDSSWPLSIFASIETMKLLFNTRLYSDLQKLSSLSIVVNFWAVVPSSSKDFLWFYTIYPSLWQIIPEKGDSAGEEAWMDNHETGQIIKWSKYGPLQVQESTNRIFVNQICLSVRYFWQSNAFNVKIAFNFTFWRRSNIGCPNAAVVQYVYFYTSLLSPPPLYKMFQNKRRYTSQYSSIFLLLKKLGNSTTLIPSEKIYLSVMVSEGGLVQLNDHQISHIWDGWSTAVL